jgi:hypothetical protein
MDFGEWGLDELRRIPLPRTRVHKVVGSPGLLLAVDLNE